jgi:hypothetical protein
MFFQSNYYYAYPPMLPYPAYMVSPPYQRSYPPVDTKIFTSSVKSFRLLMSQGSILLDKLGNEAFAHKLMGAAQEGKQSEVDRMIKSLGLKVPVATKFTPSGIDFVLSTRTDPAHPISCCTLVVSMKWGM